LASKAIPGDHRGALSPTKANPTFVDLFAGAGGFSLGFQAAGFRSLAAWEIDEAAASTYRANFERLQPDAPPLVNPDGVGDLTAVDFSQYDLHPDVLIGGPPCQGFALVGRGRLNDLREVDVDDETTTEGLEFDPRNQLYKRFLDAARHWRPRVVVIENVPGMLSIGRTNVADLVAADVARCGYNVGYGLLNTAWYGVPQFRSRLIFVGVRKDVGGSPSLPPAVHRGNVPASYAIGRPNQLALPFAEGYELEVPHSRGGAPFITVAEALDDLPRISDHLGEAPARRDFRRPLPYDRNPHSNYATAMRNWPGLLPPAELVDHVVRRTPRDHETFGLMRQGDKYSDAVRIAESRFQDALSRKADKAPAPGTEAYEDMRNHYVPPYPEGMFLDKWHKLIADQPSWTIVAHLAKDSYSHIHHGDQRRMISVREAARLQSFPDGYTFSGNMGDCFRQIGNAVPPHLAQAIARHVREQWLSSP
jgi:DNA (cytosine-5)-methyltransferase 1